MTNADCFFWNAALLPVSSHVGESGGMSLASHQLLMRLMAPTVSGLLRATLPSLSTSEPPSFQMIATVLPKPSGVGPSGRPHAYTSGGLLDHYHIVVTSSRGVRGSTAPGAGLIQLVRANRG